MWSTNGVNMNPEPLFSDPLKVHPLRQALNDEIHARPPLPLVTPALVSFLACTRSTHTPADERAHLVALPGVPSLGERLDSDTPHWIGAFETFSLKWEQHGEFSTYTFFRTPTAAPESGETALDTVPADWLSALPGDVLVATHIELLSAEGLDIQALIEARISTHEGTQIISRIAGEAAWLLSDLRIHEGFSRFTVIDESMGFLRTRRIIQRILEIETYRIMALLAFPVAKSVGRLLSRAEAELAGLIDRTVAAAGPGDERAILADLTRLAAEVERSVANTSFRFGASAAYYRLVQQRIGELKETRISGYPTIQGFMERRLAPALNTCAATARRQDELSARIARTSQLLRTRVDIELEHQNQSLLSQMNRRAHLQLRLQETVEGLSVVVLTYYGSQLVQYLAKGTKDWHHFSTDVITALSIPVIAGLVFWGSRRIRRKLAHTESASPEQ